MCLLTTRWRPDAAVGTPDPLEDLPKKIKRTWKEGREEAQGRWGYTYDLIRALVQ